MIRRAVALLLFAGCLTPAPAQHAEHGGPDRMQIGRDGIVMNENRDVLPRGCESLGRDHEFTIRAGRAYARDEPGVIFGMSERTLNVQPCSRVTVHFINEDEVRHQWMVHGLPRYLYPAGMFHLEAMGGSRQSGTFIVPAEHRNYLVHCDMAQHMEKGMRAQLVVGDGSGTLWGITGVSDAFRRADYLPGGTPGWLIVVVALSATVVAGAALVRRRRS